MSHFIIWSIVGLVLRHAERAGEHAVRAADAARLERALHDAVRRLLDGVGRADLRADRVLAVHADLRRGLHAVAPLDRLEMDHRAPAVRVALAAGLHARLAADAARVVDEEGELAHRMPPAAGSSPAIAPDGSGAFDTRTAQILNSGIFEIGIDGADGAVVGGPVQRPVIGDEDRVGADGLHHLRADDDRAAPAFDADEVAVGDAERRRQARMHLAQRLRILIDQRADAARLRAGEVLRHHAAGGQDDRILGVRLFGGGPPVDRRGSAPCRRGGRTCRPS